MTNTVTHLAILREYGSDKLKEHYELLKSKPELNHIEKIELQYCKDNFLVLTGKEITEG